MTGGRPPGRPLDPLELEHLRLLLELRQRAATSNLRYDELLQDFVLRCREGGASARSIADAVGVSPSTVQGWTAAARRRRG